MITTFSDTSFSDIEWRYFLAEEHPFLIMGRRSYIVGSEFQGDADANLIIGKYTSIASGVKFQLHNNHHYSNFTTYPFHDLKIASLEPKKEKLKKQLIIGMTPG